MANKILVIGESGSGKSTATRNLDPESTFYINVINKPLPFRGWRGKYKPFNSTTKEGNLAYKETSEEIVKALEYIDKNLPKVKTIVVDDAQYIMSYEFMRRAREKGFDKFTEIAQKMWFVFRKPEDMREDLTVVFLAHSEDVSANGYIKTKIKTIGKMLDDKITVEGMFTIVLQAVANKVDKEKVEHKFVTRSDGTTTVKTPMDMFSEMYIDNDLKYVIDEINKYNTGE